MPPRLTHYTAMELLRVIGLAAAILAAVTAFGAVIKPLTGDAPLSALQALKYVGLSLVPMMQYAIPFAAGFGATIVFHRMATDNEIMAMAVAGLRYRTILAPVMALGLVLILLMAILVQVVIPRVYALMGRVIAGDVTALLEHAVSEGLPVQFGDMELWAEAMDVQPHPPGSEADERIVLRRMVAARLGPRGSIESDVSAAGAVLDLYEREGIVLIRMVMDDAVSWEQSAGNLRGFPRLEPTHAIAVPLPERTEPMAMTRAELRAVSADPTRYPPIATAFDVLQDAMEQRVQRASMAEAMQGDGQVDLRAADRSGHVWRISAGGLKGGRLQSPPGGKVQIEEYDAAGRPLRVFTPKRATVDTEVGGLDGRDRRLVLDLTDVTVQDPPGAPRANHRAHVIIGNLEPFDIPAMEDGAATEHILAQAAVAAETSRDVRKALHRFNQEVEDLRGEVISRRWRRWAVAATAGLLPLLGAVLALTLRAAQPLTIYMVAFLPALLNLVLISSGTTLMRQGELVEGWAVMWSGNGILIALTAISWWKLSRH